MVGLGHIKVRMTSPNDHVREFQYNQRKLLMWQPG